VSLFATICRYDQVSESIDEVMLTGQQLASELSRVPGFVSYALVDAGQGVLVSINVFEDRTDLEAADRIVAGWVAQHLGALLPHPPEVIAGEVVVQRGM
jgi:hypothetical protein